MRKGEGGSADLIQKLAMACFYFKASQPELNIFAFNFDSNSTESNRIIPIWQILWLPCKLKPAHRLSHGCPVAQARWWCVSPGERFHQPSHGDGDNGNVSPGERFLKKEVMMVMVMVMAMCLTWSAFPQASFPPPPALPSATHSPPVSKLLFEFLRIFLFWVPKSQQIGSIL